MPSSEMGCERMTYMGLKNSASHDRNSAPKTYHPLPITQNPLRKIPHSRTNDRSSTCSLDSHPLIKSLLLNGPLFLLHCHSLHVGYLTDVVSLSLSSWLTDNRYYHYVRMATTHVANVNACLLPANRCCNISSNPSVRRRTLNSSALPKQTTTPLGTIITRPMVKI